MVGEDLMELLDQYSNSYPRIILDSKRQGDGSMLLRLSNDPKYTDAIRSLIQAIKKRWTIDDHANPTYLTIR